MLTSIVFHALFSMPRMTLSISVDESGLHLLFVISSPRDATLALNAGDSAWRIRANDVDMNGNRLERSDIA